MGAKRSLISWRDCEHSAHQTPPAIIGHTIQMMVLIGNKLAKRSSSAGRDIEIVEHRLGPGGLSRTRRNQLENYAVAGPASRGRAVEIADFIGNEPALGKCPVNVLELVKYGLRPGSLPRRRW